MSEAIPSITIRPVESADAAQLRENCFSANTLAEVEERIAHNLRAYRAGTEVHLVAEVDGVVVGTGGLVRKAHPLHAHRGELVSLVVHPDCQRRGIARRIVTDLCCRAQEFGLTILEIGCRGGTPAEVVYGQLGFIECGRLPAGIVEPWGERRVYDEVSFYMAVADLRTRASSIGHYSQPDGHYSQPDGHRSQPDGHCSQPDGHCSPNPKGFALSGRGFSPGPQEEELE